MKIVALIARILLGLVFLVFGLDKFYPFIPQGADCRRAQPASSWEPCSPVTTSGRWELFEVAGGILLLINRYVPLGLCLLAPVIVNIVLTGVLLTHMALGSGIVVAILWILVYSRHRSAFAGIFQA